MINANLELKKCLAESLLLEDDDKIKKVTEGIKNWIKNIKNKLKDVMSDFNDRIIGMTNVVSIGYTPDNVSERKLAKAELLKRSITKYEKELKDCYSKLDLMGNIDQIKGHESDIADIIARYKEKSITIYEKIQDARSELKKYDSSLVNESLLLEFKGVEDYHGKASRLSMYTAAKGHIFRTYITLVRFLVTDIKNTMKQISFHIKMCERLIVDKKIEDGKPVEVDKKYKPLTFKEKFKVYSFVINTSFRRISTQILNILDVTIIALAVGAISLGKDAYKYLKSKKGQKTVTA